jgi:hypothetical protein
VKRNAIWSGGGCGDCTVWKRGCRIVVTSGKMEDKNKNLVVWREMRKDG